MATTPPTPSATPSAPDGDARAPQSFEQILGEVDRLTTLLERGEIPLEQALEAFERGMALMRDAGLVLDQAEARLSRLVEGPRGELRELPVAGADPAPTPPRR
ncbi:MAG: exodeoxyribonuclease VII small subunit [Myxococcota bacterium]